MNGRITNFGDYALDDSLRDDYDADNNCNIYILYNNFFGNVLIFVIYSLSIYSNNVNCFDRPVDTNSHVSASFIDDEILIRRAYPVSLNSFVASII